MFERQDYPLKMMGQSASMQRPTPADTSTINAAHTDSSPAASHRSRPNFLIDELISFERDASASNWLLTSL